MSVNQRQVTVLVTPFVGRMRWRMISVRSSTVPASSSTTTSQGPSASRKAAPLTAFRRSRTSRVLAG